MSRRDYNVEHSTEYQNSYALVSPPFSFLNQLDNAMYSTKILLTSIPVMV